MSKNKTKKPLKNGCGNLLDVEEERRESEEEKSSSFEQKREKSLNLTKKGLYSSLLSSSALSLGITQITNGLSLFSDVLILISVWYHLPSSAMLAGLFAKLDFLLKRKKTFHFRARERKLCFVTVTSPCCLSKQLLPTASTNQSSPLMAMATVYFGDRTSATAKKTLQNSPKALSL